MRDWQITAKTIFCDAVDDEVTLMVYKNGTVRCTGSSKFGRPNDITWQIIKQKNQRLKRRIKCEGEPCFRLNEYCDKILNEESLQKKSGTF